MGFNSGFKGLMLFEQHRNPNAYKVSTYLIASVPKAI